MRHIISTALLCLPLLVHAAHTPLTTCPSLSQIKLVPGEYAWITEDARFEGYFVLPQQGKGSSTALTGFMQARWMQLSNLAKSPGVIECDYAGNYSGEVIRVVQIEQQSTPKPQTGQWNCAFIAEYPSTQCTCSGSLSQCAF